MLYLLATIDEGVANHLTQSKENAVNKKSEKQKTKANQKRTLPSKYGGDGAPWYVLHKDVHHTPI